MERRIVRRTSIDAGPESVPPMAPMSYRAEICRRDVEGRKSSYYDGGQFSPYCMESLIELLRGEARIPHLSLDVMLELHGECTPLTLRDVAARFGDVTSPHLLVRICAPGRAPLVIGARTADESGEHTHRERDNGKPA